MSNKEEVLEQLDQIHGALIDEEKFMPYDYRMLIIWGVISAVLFLTTPTVSDYSLLVMSLYIASIIASGFLLENYLMKKINKKYDLEKFTKKQKFIETICTIAVFFSLLLSVAFFSKGLITYGFLSWMILLSFANYVMGFVMNNKNFIKVGVFGLVAAAIVFILAILIDDNILSAYISYIAALIIGGGLVYLGFMMKKECNLV
jgi:magnesium-transporting ATPase (P-type)